MLQRLKTRPQFLAVLGGELIAKTNHFALHRVGLNVKDAAATPTVPLLLFSPRATWLGAMAPKRWAKRAVTRNAIKRQIYSVSASLNATFPQAAYLVRLRREFSRKDYASASSTKLKEAIRAELLVLLETAAASNEQESNAS